MTHILLTDIRPVLEYVSVVWNTDCNEDVRRLKSVQIHWTRHIKDLGNKEYGVRLRALNVLYSVKDRFLRADLIKCWEAFHGLSPTVPSDFMDLTSDRRTRGNRYRIKVRRCQLDTTARFFSERVVNDWHALPNWAVSSTSLREFKFFLASALGRRLYECLP